MKIVVATDAGISVFRFPDDTSFVLNEPHGFLRIFPQPPTGADSLPINRYFNMAYVVALVADGDEVDDADDP